MWKYLNVFLTVLLFNFWVLGVKAQTSLDTAVNFTVKDVNGITYHLDELLSQQKIVVIDFFTITCGPCTTYAPLISESFSHFGCNTSNVVFLGINWGGDNAGVTDFGQTYGVHYPEISGTEGNGNHVVADYGILSYPTVILILPGSQIAEKHIWPPSTQHLDSIIASYGGVVSECTVPVSQYNPISVGNNKILSVCPFPDQSIVTCTTSVASVCSLEVCSLSGSMLPGHTAVIPGERASFSTANMKQGYYLLLLRSGNGNILDHKPFLVQHP